MMPRMMVQPQFSRPINTCPFPGMGREFTGFRGSSCAPLTNARAFKIVCVVDYRYSRTGRATTSQETNVLYGLCDEGQTCIDREQDGRRIANCAGPPASFGAMVEAQRINNPRLKIVGGLNVDGGQTVQIVLTRPNSDLTVPALMIALIPTDTIGNVLGRPALCAGCRSLQLSKTPRITTRLDIEVILPDAGSTAWIRGYVWQDDQD